jgi:hypothetical protein
MSGCDVGKVNSSLESYGQSLRQRPHHVTRRTTPRSGETNDAPAGQVSHTNTVTAWLAANENVGYGRACLGRNRLRLSRVRIGGVAVRVYRGCSRLYPRG